MSTGWICRRLTEEDFSGLFKGSFEVPVGHVALARKAGGENWERFEAGASIPGKSEAFLFTGPNRPFAMNFLALPAEDSHQVTGSLEIDLGPELSEKEALVDFVGAFMTGDRIRFQTAELEDVVYDEVSKVLMDFVGKKKAQELHLRDTHEDAERALDAGLKRFCFKHGLVFGGLKSAVFRSENVQRLLDEQAKVALGEAGAANRQRLLDLWVKDQQEKALARHEVEEFFARLQQEKLLENTERKRDAAEKKLDYHKVYSEYKKQKESLRRTLEAMEHEHRLKLDEASFEAKLDQARKVKDVLDEASLEFWLQQEKDPAIKKHVYDRLVMARMTPEQLRSLSFTDHKVETLLQKVVQVVEGMLSRGVEKQIPRAIGDKAVRATRFLLMVSGRMVSVYEPAGAKPSEPLFSYDFSNANLGSLRSARVVDDDGARLLLAGARQGVYSIGFGDADMTNVREYAFCTDRVHEGGTNSLCTHNGRLYATHSEAGLATWPLDDPSLLGEPLFEELTRGHATTRGIQVKSGRLFFSAGPYIYSFDPQDTAAKPLRYLGNRSNITGFCIIDDTLYAGTDDSAVTGEKTGSIVAWDVSAPDNMRVVLRENSPIYMVRPAVIGGISHLIVGAKGFKVQVVSPDQNLETRFNCDRQIRWADGASDFIFGVSKDLHSLFVWRSEDQAGHCLELPSTRRIQDIWLVKE